MPYDAVRGSSALLGETGGAQKMKSTRLTKAQKDATVQKWADWIQKTREVASKAAEASKAHAGAAVRPAQVQRIGE